MKTMFHILPFEWKSLWRSNLLKVLLVVVLGAGIYGIYFGKFEIDKQERRIAEVQKYERQQFDSLLIWSQLDTSIAENKSKFELAMSPVGVGWTKHFTYYVTDERPPLSGLCLGQRDLYPVYYGFNVTDLTRQVNTGELANPMKLLTGNFDLSYVIVFLFPLLIVALFYDLYAGEKEGGTLRLLQSQAARLGMILLSKGLLRSLIVLVLATALLLFGFLLQGISLTQNLVLFVEWLTLTYGYCFLWIMFMAVIIWMRRSAALSAMLGLGVWLIFTLITPAMVNLVVQSSKPLPNKPDVIHTVRALNDKNWELPKSFVMDRFHAKHPEFNDGDTTDFNKWYYASFTQLDDAANELKATMEAQIGERNALLSQWEWLAPAAMVHERLSRMSETDRQSHLRFVEKVHLYHRDLKDLYYDKIFAGAQFSMADLKELESRL